MTSSEVAKLLSLSRERVVKAGKEYGVEKHGNQYWWSDEDIERLRSRMGKVGNPTFSTSDNPGRRRSR